MSFQQENSGNLGGERSLPGTKFSCSHDFTANSKLLDFIQSRRAERMIRKYKKGDLIGKKYSIIKRLQKGGMGLVYKVRRINDRKIFALKICIKEGDKDIKRFAREVRLMKRIHHRHVHKVIDEDLDGMPPWFVMPLAKNSLADEISNFVADESAAIDAFTQICLGVQAIHSSGSVHRDIKPSNALRMKNGRVTVSDLGLAKLDSRDSSELTKSNAVLGSTNYSAPEQHLPGGSREADARTDIYQLGKTLYELITGKCPALISINALPPGLSHIVSKATKQDPSDRYQTLGEFLDAIESYKKSKDPLHNPCEAFESLVAEAEDILEWAGQYDETNVKSMMAILSNTNLISPKTIIELFDKIPKRLLPIMASHYTSEFSSAFEHYAASISTEIGSFSFAYAESVAGKMKSVFNSKTDSATKTLALQVILISAVDLHRYAAMEVFNDLLRSIKLVDEAIPVAEMLRKHRKHYKMIADRIPPERLHPAIRKVRSEVL